MKAPRRSTASGGAAAISILIVLLLLAVSGCGGSSSASQDGGSSSAGTGGSGSLQGLKASPPRAAPPIELTDSLGKAVDLRDYRGKAVLVTFIYTHCPDTCPLIVSHLHTAQKQLGPEAGKLQIIAVSTDPRGDNPRTVRRFLAAHEMTGRMVYLLGDREQLGRVWKDWNVVAKPAKSGRDLVEHSAEIYGISASGKLTTLYPSNFKPSQIVNDVPILASQ